MHSQDSAEPGFVVSVIRNEADWFACKEKIVTRVAQRKRFTCKMLVVALCALPGVARADLVLDTIGDPMDGGSWFQSFSLHSPDTSFENVGIVITRFDTTAAFGSPAWDFTIDEHDTGFIEFYTDERLTEAGGSATNSIDWTTHFGGSRDSQNFQLTLFTFDTDLATDSIQSAVARWDGTQWSFFRQGGITWEQYVSIGGAAGVVHTPLPASTLLCVVGFAAVGLGRRVRGFR